MNNLLSAAVTGASDTYTILSTSTPVLFFLIVLGEVSLMHIDPVKPSSTTDAAAVKGIGGREMFATQAAFSSHQP